MQTARHEFGNSSLYLFGYEPEIAMRDLHQKLSVWEKLYQRWEHREPHAQFTGAGAPNASANDRQMCAMEVELRAMNAKADASFDAAVAALRRGARPRG